VLSRFERVSHQEQKCAKGGKDQDGPDDPIPGVSLIGCPRLKAATVLTQARIDRDRLRKRPVHTALTGMLD